MMKLLYTTTTTTCLLLLLLLLHPVHSHEDGDDGHDHPKKQLVIFAGPHKTSETSIEEFFYSYAPGGFTKTLPEHEALADWVWPQILGGEVAGRGTEPHQVYEHLVMDAHNPGIQAELLEGIAKEWELTNKGIILGSEDLDRVGSNPFSHTNAVDAIDRVIEKLKIDDAQDVTIVLLYKTPRINQWMALFNFADIEMPEGQFDGYKEYVCEKESQTERWEEVDTAMNPLHVATVFRQQGWKVVLIDMGGVQQAKRDVEHVIGCDVLGATCQNGWLEHLVNKTYAKNSAAHDTVNARSFQTLSKAEEYDLENLFRTRDCNYEALVTDPGVTILYEQTMWLGCVDVSEEIPPRLTSTDVMLDAIQTQKDCGTGPPIRDILKAEESSSGSEHHDHASKTGSSNSSHKRPKWVVPVFLLLLIVAGTMSLGGYQRRLRPGQRYGGMPVVYETRGQRPLSLIT
jgi:hypothetical protein